MKKSCFILLAICLLGMACEKKRQSLANTEWELEGIMDVQTGVLKELEPKDCANRIIKDCKKCYTLTFKTDDTLWVWSTTNGSTCIYIADYSTHSFKITNFGGTRIGEIADGGLFVDILRLQIQSFALQNKKKEKELWLYYNDKKNYLLFKQIEL